MQATNRTVICDKLYSTRGNSMLALVLFIPIAMGFLVIVAETCFLLIDQTAASTLLKSYSNIHESREEQIPLYELNEDGIIEISGDNIESILNSLSTSLYAKNGALNMRLAITKRPIYTNISVIELQINKTDGSTDSINNIWEIEQQRGNLTYKNKSPRNFIENRINHLIGKKNYGTPRQYIDAQDGSLYFDKAAILSIALYTYPRSLFNNSLSDPDKGKYMIKEHVITPLRVHNTYNYNKIED